jgi:hypothetical protein
MSILFPYIIRIMTHYPANKWTSCVAGIVRVASSPTNLTKIGIARFEDYGLKVSWVLVIRFTSSSLNGSRQLMALFLCKLLPFGSLSTVNFLFCYHYFFLSLAHVPSLPLPLLWNIGNISYFFNL